MAAAGKLSLTVLAVAMGALTSEAAPPGGYTFSVVATLGDPAPGGDVHKGDFEPGDVNNRGDVAFVSDFAAAADDNPFGEGLFARYHGITRLIARTGDLIPGTQLNYGAGVFSPLV